MATDTKDPRQKPRVLEGRHSFTSVTDKVGSIVLREPYRPGWLFGFAIAFSMLSLLMLSIGYLFLRGVGIWGLNSPVMWAFDITNFVWWIGIGHAGTLISAILLLLRQDWRTSINRFAEAMTLFAVSCAGMYPLIHLGRPWVFFWLMPYPNTMGMWPQWRSPLIFDVFAVSTYATVSLLFWYIGLIPDLATLRDKATNRAAKIIYGILALGWRGSARHWHRYKTAYLLLAGLSTPLVVSVHSIVSLDFTIGILPGWHSTIFPPYFVAGAIFSGFAMVITLMLPLRWYYGLHDFITDRHLHNMAKLMLVTGMVVTYGYFMEGFMAWYGGNPYEVSQMLQTRPFGYYSKEWWLMVFCNCVIIHMFWFPWVRTNVYLLWFLSILINIGMWLERFVIIVISLHKDFLPSSWGVYRPTFWDISTYVGSIGLFLSLLFLFVRVLPALSITEMRELVHHEQTHGPHHHGEAHAAPGSAS
jgi:molybdopterin-containing oxidoreductase family membrane subunit